ncbi:MAG: peptidylprolyl isomerase [Saprospiraceae bacterium]|nr:peptidylprolyl isomerase [Saprospiraceae bacterium]
MALLGTIRNRFGWVMMALIGIGMLSFLFMDISPGSNTSSGRSATVGYVNGDKISNDLVQMYSREYQGNQLLPEQISIYVWDRIVKEKLLDEKTYNAGILVTPDEMGDMFVSSDPSLLSSIVKRYFGDSKKGGYVNTEEIKQRIEIFHNTSSLLKQAGDDPRKKEELLEQQKNWVNLEKTVKLNRLQNKFFKAIGRGVYTPLWMAQMEQKTQKTAYNFDYVRIPYTNINDKIDVSDQELKDYISARPRQYKREAAANINYIVFDVFPTSEDSATYRTEMESYADDFSKRTTSKDDSAFVDLHYGEYAAAYYTKEEMSEPKDIIDSIFALEDGIVLGPYIHNRKYRVLKKIEQKTLPDSVKARHILIRAENPQDGQKARLLLDSLKNVLATDSKASFDSLAVKYSQDGSRTIGGDLGWKAKDGSFVPQFEEYMFYTGKKDSLRLLYTQFGVHLIQITGYKYETDKQGVRIAYIDQDIIPSPGTTEDKQREVIDFITNNRIDDDMKATAKELGFVVNTASALEEGGFSIDGIGENSTSADIIKWAHDTETEIGEVTNRPYAVENEELNCTEKFVVTSLVSRNEKGLASIDDPKVKGDVDRIIRNQKKTDLVKSRLATLTSLDAIAGEYSLIKETATNVTYESGYLGTIGSEPKVVALAAVTEVGQMSGAIGGKEGVYILELTSISEAPKLPQTAGARKSISQRIGQIVSAESIYNNMKDNADIQDDRSSY